MKNLPSLRLEIRFCSRPLVVAALAFFPLAAQDLTSSQIQQSKADQQLVRDHTAQVVTQVQELIDELIANGISGDDVKILQTTKLVLNNLSDKEMGQVLASLQKAVESPTSTTGQQNALSAYAGQKGIILQFREILKEYEQRQAAYELPVRFKDLSDRQTATMQATLDIARVTAGKGAGELNSMQATTEQIVQADQAAIVNETNIALDQLNKAVQGSTGDQAKVFQQAADTLKSGVLQTGLTKVDQDLKSGQLLKALTDQKTVRDELRHVVQALSPAADEVEALQTTSADLDKLIAGQKALLDATNAAVGVKPAATGLDTKQAALVDKADLLQQDMQALSPATSTAVKSAMDPMQTSRYLLSQPRPENFTKASDSQQDVLNKLQDAQKQMQQQLADAEKAEDEAQKDPLTKLEDVQKQIQSAMKTQQQVNQASAQAIAATPPDPTALSQAQQQQNQLQSQTTTLQQTAQAVSLPAAQALADAANAMNKAQADLADPSKEAGAAANQQTAEAQLAQASQQVSDQINQMQQQSADPAALQAAADALQQAQNSVSTAIADSAPVTSTPPVPTAPPTMAEAAAALAQATRETEAAAATPGLPDAASQAVKAAQSEIAKGEQAAAQKNAPSTASAATAAQGDLALAQAAVAMAQAGMAAGSMAGVPPESGAPAPNGPPGSVPGTKMGAGSTATGTLHDSAGAGKFVSFIARDRTALDQSQAEKRPQEYAPMIDQYLKNLADQSSAPSP